MYVSLLSQIQNIFQMNKSLAKKECWKVLNKKFAQVILIYLYEMLWAIIEKKKKQKKVIKCEVCNIWNIFL